jgi:hypothetical protein
MKKLTYPRLWHQRGRECDIKFILSRMAVIPEHLKDSISHEYERIYTSSKTEARRKANEYLHGEAIKYKQKPKSDVRINAEPPKQAREPLNRKIDTKPTTEREKPRKSFLDGLLDDVDSKYRGKK